MNLSLRQFLFELPWIAMPAGDRAALLELAEYWMRLAEQSEDDERSQN